MDVFISWSGEKSRKAAEAMRNWLPKVIQVIKPYYTPQDIDKGARWSSDIAEKLEKSEFSIIFLTKENLNAPWILFEAGAISKNISTARVCPILIDIKPTDIAGPLSQFQATKFEKTEIRQMLDNINDILASGKLDKNTLDDVFEKWWSELEQSICDINDDHIVSKEEIRSDRELIEEILRLTRKEAYPSFKTKELLRLPSQKKSVEYDSDSQKITVFLGGKQEYDIYLEHVNSGSELLDYILQLNRKPICEAQEIKDFLDCIEQLTDRYFKTNAQGVFCPCGHNKEVDWPRD